MKYCVVTCVGVTFSNSGRRLKIDSSLISVSLLDHRKPIRTSQVYFKVAICTRDTVWDKSMMMFGQRTIIAVLVGFVAFPFLPDTTTTTSMAFSVGTTSGTSSSNRVFVSTPVSKHPKRTVQDCMTPANHVLRPEMSVDETMNLLLQYGLSGAPVVNENQNVVGIVTTHDLIQREAYEGALLPMDGTAETIQSYVDCAQKICGTQVRDVMTTNPITVPSQTPMRVAALTLMERKLHRLPVIDEVTGKLMGVLTSEDVMRDLLYIVRNLPEAGQQQQQQQEGEEVSGATQTNSNP